MTIAQALRIVIDYLDELMDSEPNRALADASNLLEDLLAKLSNES